MRTQTIDMLYLAKDEEIFSCIMHMLKAHIDEQTGIQKSE